MNAPNKITLFRVILIPVFVVIFLLRIPNETASDIIALCIFSVASLSDFLDGYLARKNNMVTDFGKLVVVLTAARLDKLLKLRNDHIPAALARIVLAEAVVDLLAAVQAQHDIVHLAV